MFKQHEKGDMVLPNLKAREFRNEVVDAYEMSGEAIDDLEDTSKFCEALAQAFMVMVNNPKSTQSNYMLMGLFAGPDRN